MPVNVDKNASFRAVWNIVSHAGAINADEATALSKTVERTSGARTLSNLECRHACEPPRWRTRPATSWSGWHPVGRRCADALAYPFSPKRRRRQPAPACPKSANMYGPAALSRRTSESDERESCINVSGLCSGALSSGPTWVCADSDSRTGTLSFEGKKRDRSDRCNPRTARPRLWEVSTSHGDHCARG